MRIRTPAVALIVLAAGFLAGNATPNLLAPDHEQVFEQIGNRTSAYASVWGCEQMGGDCPASTQEIAAELSDLWNKLGKLDPHRDCYTPEQASEITMALQDASDAYQLAAWHMTCE